MIIIFEETEVFYIFQEITIFNTLGSATGECLIAIPFCHRVAKWR